MDRGASPANSLRAAIIAASAGILSGSEHPDVPALRGCLQCWGEPGRPDGQEYARVRLLYVLPLLRCAYSTKDCVAEGDVAWFQQYDECRGFDKEFTFYNECEKSDVINELIRDRYMVRDVLWGISLVFILPAIIIFLSYRQLRTRNNIVHVNFFTAHLLSSLFFLIYDVTISLDALDGQSGTSTADGGVGCVIFTVLVHKYLRLTSYAWMFCEGFHLHQLIAAAFQKTSMPALYIIGWVFPVVPVIIYVILRATNPNYDAWCWAAPAGGLEWIITSCIIAAFFVHACLRRTLYHKFPSMRPVPKGRPSVSGTQVTNDYSMTQPPNNNEEAPKNPPAAQTKF
ncbi:PREDICTED: calcitonin gene-related peptide type 1 receptor-like [Priapulus caudatus]|uniref:Calcitonin gene-related peptide type 1 receptor-like n=1 Tax=Priapulus caudatus TaxID=37621 RepID=A0ABM1ERN8_PRICU|nr:PREDICTED: calcitonin gene-related peptide type 1 receptor-like [Priapulus caudatus]